MKQDLMKKFKVTGRCSEMQTLSLEQVCELMDGVPYDIDLRPGQPCWGSDGNPLENMSTSSIMNLLLAPPEVPALPSRDKSCLTQKDWEYFEKQKKRENKRRKKVSPEKAYKKIKHTLKRLGVEN